MYPRALQTALVINQHTRTSLNEEPRFIERILHPTEIDAKQALANIERRHREHTWAPPGGQSVHASAQEFEEGIQSILAHLPESKSVIIVSHARKIQDWLGLFHGQHPLLGPKTQPRTASVTRVDYLPDALPQVQFVGYVPDSSK